MIFTASKRTRLVALVAGVAIVAACSLPRSGPNKREIFEGSVQKQGDAYVVSVNDRVTRATAAVPVFGFSETFESASVTAADVIRAGDTLGLTVWENSDVPLLGAPQAATVLEQVQVDDAGFIFVPYAGRIKAAGNTPESLRQVITRKLDAQTPDPQVMVRRLAGDGATVSIVGNVGAQGVFPIERPTRMLSAMLAQAGGIGIDPEVAMVTIIRGGNRSKVWLQDLYDDPRADIALRANDRILVEADTRTFTALGATGSQTRVPFETRTISAIEALATVGGLNSALADPTGVFVFRNEPAAIANAVLGRDDLQGAQRMIYVLNLTEPNGMFTARDFAIREDDTVYVTEAPYVQWTKTLTAISTPLSTVDSLASTFN